MKNCPLCGKEYDEELYEECPFCKDGEEHEAEAVEALADDAYFEKTVVDEDAIKEENAEDDEPFEGEIEDEETKEKAAKKTKLILNSIIAFLAVLIVLVLGRIIYLNMPYNAPNTIDVDSFSASDVDGTYTDELSGQYFNFEKKSTDVDVSPMPDLTALSDAEALSDGALSSEKTEIKTFEGTFESGYIKEEVQNLAIKIFILNTGYGEEYITYKIVNNLKTEAYEEFLKAYGYEKEYSDFEAAQNIVAQLEADKMNGYWDLKDGELNLYDERGNLITSCGITQNGIVISSIHFEGKVKKAMLSENTLVYTSEDGTIRQTITTYKDGNFVLTTEREGQKAQKEAGMYCVTEDSMTLSIGGSVDSFNLTDFGMTQQLFNKK